MAELSEDELLLAELGVEIEIKKPGGRTAHEERVIAGFDDILRFVEEHKRVPSHGDDRDIFERLYAARLDRLREQADCRALLEPFDPDGLLGAPPAVDDSAIDELDDEDLLAELGIETEPAAGDITQLRHVKPRSEVRAAEEIAERTPCPDFQVFEPLFAAIRADLAHGVRETRRFGTNAEISQGEFFIVGGQMAYVAVLGEEFVGEHGRKDNRLRVIYDNGTESDILRRSLQRALYKDEAGRRITDPDAGPLFGSEAAEDDLASGTIYVLRSMSDHPVMAEHRQVLHKIGVTGGEVSKRIAGAKDDPTFLFAPAEIIAEYKVHNINRMKLENILHRVFATAQLDLEIPDRFGKPFRPREWFMVPLPIIDDVITKIRDGSIVNYTYDPAQARLVAAKHN
ncbi:GIY-YIG nuclease family protein [Methylobacterium fujisawaense]